MNVSRNPAQTRVIGAFSSDPNDPAKIIVCTAEEGTTTYEDIPANASYGEVEFRGIINNGGEVYMQRFALLESGKDANGDREFRIIQYDENDNELSRISFSSKGFVDGIMPTLSTFADDTAYTTNGTGLEQIFDVNFVAQPDQPGIRLLNSTDIEISEPGLYQFELTGKAEGAHIAESWYTLDMISPVAVSDFMLTVGRNPGDLPIRFVGSTIMTIDRDATSATPHVFRIKAHIKDDGTSHDMTMDGHPYTRITVRRLTKRQI